MRNINELPECPVATTISLVGNKWKLLIIRNLTKRTWRFNELQKSLNGISQKVLTDSLRQLESDGIIFRKDYHTNPPKVEYGMTDLGLELKDTTIAQLGKAKQVKVQKENTIIVDGAGDKQQIADRVGQIKAQINETQSDYDKEQLQERLAKIAGGVAVIGVGAATEVEMKDKKLRIEDALSATKAAVEEGIVSGGGTALINVIPKVSKLVDTLENGEKLGAQIVLKALEEPVKQIAVNAGLEPAVIVNKVKESEAGIGFDAANEQYVDMKKVGIVDPTKVTRSALQNAASIASMVLTTESLVTDAPEPKNCNCGSQEGGMPAGMDGMY